MSDIDLAKNTAAAVWSCPEERLVAEDASALYPWAGSHSMVLVENPSFRRALIAVGADGACIPFHQPQQLDSLNRLLELSGLAELPDPLTPEQLAVMVRTLLLAPGGFVGSPAFAEREKDALEIWTSRDPEKASALFQEFSKEPELLRRATDWGLVFFYFNTLGGVEKWKVVGDQRSIREARSEPAAPNGAFLFPYG